MFFERVHTALSLFTLHTLRYLGLLEDVIYAVYWTVIVVVPKVTYASSTCSGNSQVQLISGELMLFFVDWWASNLKLFLHHRSTQYTLLLNSILNQHILFPLLLRVRDTHYSHLQLLTALSRSIIVSMSSIPLKKINSGNEFDFHWADQELFQWVCFHWEDQ